MVSISHSICPTNSEARIPHSLSQWMQWRLSQGMGVTAISTSGPIVPVMAVWSSSVSLATSSTVMSRGRMMWKSA